MRCIAWSAIIVLTAFGSTPLASAQSVFQPQGLYSPYSRPHLSPYLNLLNAGSAATTYYNGVLREFDFRNQAMMPFLARPDLMSGYDTSRYAGNDLYPSGGPASAEEWIGQRLRETQLSPSGHVTGYLMAYPYYTMPNQRSFMPYNPNANRPIR